LITLLHIQHRLAANTVVTDEKGVATISLILPFSSSTCFVKRSMSSECGASSLARWSGYDSGIA